MVKATNLYSSDYKRQLESSPLNSIESRVTESDMYTPDSNEVHEYYEIVNFTLVDVVAFVFSFTLYFTNVGIHLSLISTYVMYELSLYAGLTLSFILLPALAMSIFLILEYMNRIKIAKLHSYPLPKIVEKRLMCLVFLISLFTQSQTEAIYYGLQYRKELEKESQTGGLTGDKEWEKTIGHYVVMLYVNKRTAALLGLIVGFLGCAPQILLQLHIMASSSDLPASINFWQCASVSISIVNLAWAVASFVPMRRVFTAATEDALFIVVGIVFLCQIMALCARAIAVSLFAAAVPWIVWPLVLMYHFLTVSNATEYLTPKIEIHQLEYEDDSTGNESYWERVRRWMMETIICTFTLMHNDNKTQARKYDMLCLVENVIVIAIWFAWSSSSERDWYQYLKVAGHFALFAAAHYTRKLLVKHESRLNDVARLLNSEQDRDERRAAGDFSTFHFATLLITLTLYLADVSTDILLAGKYLNRDDYWYSGLTLGFVLLPALLTSLRNVSRYMKSWNNSNHCHVEPRLPKWMRILRYVGTVAFPLSALSSCVETMYHGVRYALAKQHGETEEMKQQCTLMDRAKANVLTNQVTVALLGCAPQMALQLYVLQIAKYSGHDEATLPTFTAAVSVFLSVLSMVWALVSWRTSRNDSKRLVGRAAVGITQR